jgi:NADH:ubiquinone oxidoreductase subunit E
MADKSPIVRLRLRRAGPVLVCKKCLGRMDGGGKLKRRLKSELKRRSSATKVKRPRLVLTNCFGLCPKQAVVMASAETLGRGEFVLLSDTASSSVEEVADALMAVGE